MIPDPIDDPTVWLGSDFPEPRVWVIELDDVMQDEIVAVTKDIRSARSEDLFNADFPLPACGSIIKQVRNELETGRGFSVLSGFPVERLSVEEARRAYAGFCSHLGRPIIQNGAAERMVDVRDIGREYSARSRGYSGTALLPFHTDGTKGEPEILHYTGVLCLETAAQGGLSAIASAPALFNELLHLRPDLMPSLMRGYRHHRQGDHPADHSPVSAEPIPVFSFSNDLLHCRYNRNNMVWAAKDSATLTETDIEAFDLIDRTVAGPGFALSMDLQKGDLQIINNFTVLHSRTEYTDAPGRKRHLLRLWLYNPDARRDGHRLVELFAPPHSRFSDTPWRAA